MIANLAASISKFASKPIYHPIQFLLDRRRVDNAFRASGYFRWVTDILAAILEHAGPPSWANLDCSRTGLIPWRQ